MLNYSYWYAASWLLVLVLYRLRLSALNVPVDGRLVMFTLISVAASVLFGTIRAGIPRRSEPETSPYGVTAPKSRYRAAPLLLITAGFAADWAYQGGIPLFATGGYSGYDPNALEQDVVGIPYFHVALVALTLFYAFFLCDQYSRGRERRALYALAACVGIFVLNQSRGYAIFPIVVLAILVASRRLRSPRGMVRPWITTAVVAVALSAAMGVYGNLRSGFPWNDFSNFKRIAGFYDPYRSGAFDVFSWAYSYLTSPFANLANAMQTITPEGSSLGVLLGFVPRTFSKLLLPSLGGSHIVEYLNADTAYSQAYLYFGTAGLYMTYAGMVLYFAALDFAISRIGHYRDLLGAVFVLFSILTVFYNPFNNPALSYVPLLILALAFRARSRATKALGIEPSVARHVELNRSPVGLAGSSTGRYGTHGRREEAG